MNGAIKAKLDSAYTDTLALPYFTQFLDSVANTNSDNYKTQIKQVYTYLGGYYVAKEDYNNALIYYQKLLAQQPEDAVTKSTVNKIKKYLKDANDYKKQSEKTKNKN